MDIDVTDYLDSVDHGMISASRAEIGADAGPITWSNACEESRKAPILATREDCDAARDWLGEFGAWTDEELAQDPDEDIRALVLQFISGDIREAQSLAPGDGPGGIDWTEYRRLQEAGTCSSYLFLGDDGRVYFGVDS
jgi:hypothetical protein